MTFGEKLQALRKKEGMSQDALAEKLGVSRQAVSRWELDSTMPETEKVVALSDLFGVTTDYLLRPEMETPASSRREKGSRFLTEHLGTLARILGWAAVAWGVLDLVRIAALLLTVGMMWGSGGEKVSPIGSFSTVLLSAFVMPGLYAALKIAVGVALIRFGGKYARDRRERG